MNPVFPSFSRFISISLLSIFSVQAGESYPVATTMRTLFAVPYRLYARSADTEQQLALNCFTAVLYALRREFPGCSILDIRQAQAYWWPRSRPLRLGESRIGPRGALLLSRAHFLLLEADSNGNGVIDGGDPVIHAYFRPLEINSIDDWLVESGRPPVRYLPLDENFPCRTAEQRRGLDRVRRK